MINSAANRSCPFPNLSQPMQIYPVTEDHLVPSAMEASAAAVQETPFSSSLLYNLSMLKEKVNQVQSLVSILISPDQSQQSIAVASMNSLVQEIMVTASSLMFVCQQMSLTGNKNATTNVLPDDQNITARFHQSSNFGTDDHNMVQAGRGVGFYSSGENENLDNWYDPDDCNNSNNNNRVEKKRRRDDQMNNEGSKARLSEASPENNIHQNYDIIELDAADLLAKYTHYCQVCGKGFKRDANLRMHMRAHGDEYKTSAALSNPAKNMSNCDASGGNDEKCSTKSPKKYSCPFEGCRWNQRHAKFQPLKSMICVKNHYKRSHCPKMYVCKRCNRKQFSVLSDLRTHEKHCGDLKWQCSCGTTFSRKDKLMGHVALFVGHAPVVAKVSAPAGGFEQQRTQMQVDDRG